VTVSGAAEIGQREVGRRGGRNIYFLCQIIRNGVLHCILYHILCNDILLLPWESYCWKPLKLLASHL